MKSAFDGGYSDGVVPAGTWLNRGHGTKEKTISGAAELAKAIGAKPRDVTIWVDRLELPSCIQPTTQGVGRRFNRENAFDLAICAALNYAGIRPSVAVMRLREVLANAQARPRPEYAVFWNGDIATIQYFQDIASAQSVIKEGKAIVYALIPIGYVVRMVERAFAT